jgi:hypothetical protein
MTEAQTLAPTPLMWTVFLGVAAAIVTAGATTLLELATRIVA